MAHQVANGSFISLGGTDMSSDGTSISDAHSTDLPEDTSFADTFKQRLIGLQDYQLSLEFNQNYVDDGLDEDLEALKATNFAVLWRPDDAVVGTGNPEYQFTGAISSMTKTHQLNNVMTVSVTIMNTTTATVTRAVA